jgi:hypothetical protein
MTHGWGLVRDRGDSAVPVDAFGAAGTGALRDAGFNVLTWDSRGFGESGGTVMVDHKDFEGRDVSALLDWLAAQPEARLDGPGDPRAYRARRGGARPADRRDRAGDRVAFADHRALPGRRGEGGLGRAARGPRPADGDAARRDRAQRRADGDARPAHPVRARVGRDDVVSGTTMYEPTRNAGVVRFGSVRISLPTGAAGDAGERQLQHRGGRSDCGVRPKTSISGN